ncbi:hypothetical protein DRO38_07090 [Candidatus Bathyarchaeota archaeon]|nr:MAG: hypothetical protein DRO38_07090 [Candidatus Bathyarchaeota archaeon]
MDENEFGEELGKNLVEAGLKSTKLRTLFFALKKEKEEGFRNYLRYKIGTGDVSPKVLRVIEDAMDKCKENKIDFLKTFTIALQNFYYFRFEPFIKNYSGIENTISNTCHRNGAELKEINFDTEKDKIIINTRIKSRGRVNKREVEREMKANVASLSEGLRKLDFDIRIRF